MKTIMYSKSYKIRLICTNKKNNKFNFNGLLKCYSWAPTSNNCRRNAWNVEIFGMCIESVLVKFDVNLIAFNLLKYIRLSLNWIHEKEEGVKNKREMIELFSQCQIICFLIAPTVFLPSCTLYRWVPQREIMKW